MNYNEENIKYIPLSKSDILTCFMLSDGRNTHPLFSEYTLEKILDIVDDISRFDKRRLIEKSTFTSYENLFAQFGKLVDIYIENIELSQKLNNSIFNSK